MALLGDRAWWLPRWLERTLPHFDIEGEAVERELALTDWPEPNTTAAVVGEGVGVTAGDVRLVDDVALRVEPGEALVVTATDARGPRALLLALAGRAALEGRARVGGHLLPGPRGLGARARRRRAARGLRASRCATCAARSPGARGSS